MLFEVGQCQVSGGAIATGNGLSGQRPGDTQHGGVAVECDVGAEQRLVSGKGCDPAWAIRRCGVRSCRR